MTHVISCIYNGIAIEESEISSLSNLPVTGIIWDHVMAQWQVFHSIPHWLFTVALVPPKKKGS